VGLFVDKAPDTVDHTDQVTNRSQMIAYRPQSPGTGVTRRRTP
jgi:hypothetical protein